MLTWRLNQQVDPIGSNSDIFNFQKAFKKIEETFMKPLLFVKAV